jgi:nucleoside-diphosphate-sugar epimerase
MSRGKNCVITGGSGFIGTHLTQYLVEQGVFQHIHTIDIADPKIQYPNVHHHRIDIKGSIDLKLEDCDVIFHLAAAAKDPGFTHEEYFLNNHLGSANVANFADANNVKNIVYTSTIMVYDTTEVPKTEQSAILPTTAYGTSKLLGECELQKWAAASHEKKVRIVRPAVVFGKYENGNFARLAQALSRGRFYYIGRKSTIKGGIYVKELVRFLFYCIQNEMDNDVFNLSFPEELTIEKVCKAICLTMGYGEPSLIIPFKLALAASYPFELLNNLGILKTPIHHRRVEKLYHSSNVVPHNALKNGYQFAFNIQSAIEDWKKDCNGGPLK